MTGLDQAGKKILISIQGGSYWDGETRLENMIKILEELIRKTTVDGGKESSTAIKLQKILLLILSTLEYHGFDVHSSRLAYVIPGIDNFEFQFKGFVYDAILNFSLVADEEERKLEEKKTRCSYKFVHIDNMQENLFTLVEKFSKTKGWREVRDSLQRETALA